MCEIFSSNSVGAFSLSRAIKYLALAQALALFSHACKVQPGVAGMKGEGLFCFLLLTRLLSLILSFSHLAYRSTVSSKSLPLVKKTQTITLYRGGKSISQMVKGFLSGAGCDQAGLVPRVGRAIYALFGSFYVKFCMSQE